MPRSLTRLFYKQKNNLKQRKKKWEKQTENQIKKKKKIKFFERR